MRRITIITETFLPELNGMAMTLHRMLCDYWQAIKDLEDTDSKEWWQHGNSVFYFRTQSLPLS